MKRPTLPFLLLLSAAGCALETDSPVDAGPCTLPGFGSGWGLDAYRARTNDRIAALGRSYSEVGALTIGADSGEPRLVTTLSELEGICFIDGPLVIMRTAVTELDLWWGDLEEINGAVSFIDNEDLPFSDVRSFLCDISDRVQPWRESPELFIDGVAVGCSE